MSVEGGPRKFPVLAAVAEAYRLPLKHYPALMRTAAGWIVLQAAAAWSISWAWGFVLQSDATTSAWFYGLPLLMQSMLMGSGPNLISVVVSAAMAVTWHRFVILDERPGGWLPFHPIRTARYLGRWLIVTLAVVGIMSVLVAASFTVPGVPDAVLSFVPLAMILSQLFAFVRFGLAFPAAAVDERQWTLRRSWRETRGNSLRLTGGVLLLWLPWMVISVALSFVGEPAQDAYFMRTVLPVFFYALSAAGVIVSAGFYANVFFFFASPAARAQNIAAEFS